MRGPATLDDVIAGVLREAKTAAAVPARAAPADGLRKVAAALRALPDEAAAPTYADLYTVKVALYGR